MFPFNLLQKKLEFPQRPPKEAVFIPAMIDAKDGNGKLYGRYTIEDVKAHPSYQVRYWNKDEYNPLCDICSAKLGKGRRNNTIEDSQPEPTNQKQDNSLKPLPLHPYLPFHNKDTPQHRVWRVIGYGGHLYEGRMLQMEGIEHYSKDQQNVIKISPAAKYGMSGGPWLLIGGNAARGIQSSIHPLTNISWSPRITEEMLDNIKLSFDSKKITEEKTDKQSRT